MPIVELRGELPGAVLGFLDETVSRRGCKHWRWKYADRTDDTPSGFCWVEGDDRVTGFIGLMKTALQTSDASYDAAWFVDWHVAPGSQGVGIALLRKAEAAAGVLLTLQGSEDTRQILPRLGWRESAVPKTCVRPLGRRFVSRWLASRVPSPVRPVAAVAGSLTAPLWRCRRPTAPAGMSLLDVDRFKEDYDAVWQLRRAEFAPAMRRDSAYLNYLCADYPSGGYRLWLVRSGDATLGHLVLRNDTDPGGLRRGRIVDLLWPRGRKDVAEWLIERSCWELQRDGADYVECVASLRDLLAALRARGFRARSTVPIWYHRLPADAPAPDDWYVTFLDCDRTYR